MWSSDKIKGRVVSIFIMKLTQVICIFVAALLLVCKFEVVASVDYRKQKHWSTEILSNHPSKKKAKRGYVVWKEKLRGKQKKQTNREVQEIIVKKKSPEIRQK